MTRPIHRTLAVLAILAMGASQVLGLARGWVCYCSGAAVEVTGPDCSAVECHHEHDDHSGETEPEDHRHERLTQPLLGRAFVPLAVDAPLTVDFDAPPVFDWLLRFQPLPRQTVTPPPPPGCRPPPQSIVVARTVVLLV